jgi:hypothetical protein
MATSQQLKSQTPSVSSTLDELFTIQGSEPVMSYVVRRTKPFTGDNCFVTLSLQTRKEFLLFADPSLASLAIRADIATTFLLVGTCFSERTRPSKIFSTAPANFLDSVPYVCETHSFVLESKIRPSSLHTSSILNIAMEQPVASPEEEAIAFLY